MTTAIVKKTANPDHVTTAQAYMKKYKTKSATIRKMFADGISKADIARAMNIRYQHVRNVLVQMEEKSK